jgi:hypothetical protein
MVKISKISWKVFKKLKILKIKIKSICEDCITNYLVMYLIYLKYWLINYKRRDGFNTLHW